MKKLTTLFTIIISLGFIFFESTVFADDSVWQCGNLFVGKGVHSFKVIKHCGEPILKEDIGHSGSHDSGATKEKWIYGPYSDYYYIVYIKAGIVEKVESSRHDD